MSFCSVACQSPFSGGSLQTEKLALLAPSCDMPAIPGFTSASALASWSALDPGVELAVLGPGYLTLVDEGSDTARRHFSRYLELRVSPEGYLESSEGYRLKGSLPIDTEDPCPGKLRNLRVPDHSQPTPTTQINIVALLDSRASILTFDQSEPTASSNSATVATVRDSNNTPRGLHVYFNNTGGNAYSFTVMGDGTDLVAGTPGYEELGSGRLSFTPNGALQTANATPLQLDFGNGAAAGQEILISGVSSERICGGLGVHRARDSSRESASDLRHPRSC